MKNKFKTTVESLKTLNKYEFSIPTYQRPYVWGDEEIKKILDDFYLSFKSSKVSIYYVSTFLTKEDEYKSELIDGQQRFTTLWLISFVISRLSPTSSISKFLLKNDKLRLGFEIREEVSEFLNSLLQDEILSTRIYSQEYIIEYPYLKNIAKALVFINSYLNQKPNNEIKSFGNYIYSNVKLIKNTTAENTDLNKLFSTINSSGVQLEQTDIVKANLLKLIDDKLTFSRIWETCEDMNNFFERNARSSFPNSDWGQINLNKLVPFEKTIFKTEIQSEDSNLYRFKIDDINVNDLYEYSTPSKIAYNENERNSEEIFCRSIINFSQLLLHTYRIHLKRENFEDFEGTFHANRLITIFKEMEDRQDRQEIKRFFYLLWEVRYLFDKYIIKWISDNDTKNETLELVNFNKNKDGYYSRSKYEKSNSLMLQSVLYFTGDYLRQYWLTTYLYYLANFHLDQKADNYELLEYLESIDNIFSTTKDITDKILSWELMGKNNMQLESVDIESYLNSNIGQKFNHYWFQKLEYLLWKSWPFDKTKEFNNYKIMSKNSIEHIYPQNPEVNSNTPKLEDSNVLNSFGNLVLLSVSQNSEYSRKSFLEKKGIFFNKSAAYDTLKSYYIFTNDLWNSNSIEKHKNDMIKIILNHYNHA